MLEAAAQQQVDEREVSWSRDFEQLLLRYIHIYIYMKERKLDGQMFESEGESRRITELARRQY